MVWIGLVFEWFEPVWVGLVWFEPVWFEPVWFVQTLGCTPLSSKPPI